MRHADHPAIGQAPRIDDRPGTSGVDHRQRRRRKVNPTMPSEPGLRRRIKRPHDMRRVNRPPKRRSRNGIQNRPHRHGCRNANQSRPRKRRVGRRRRHRGNDDATGPGKRDPEGQKQGEQQRHAPQRAQISESPRQPCGQGPDVDNQRRSATRSIRRPKPRRTRKKTYPPNPASSGSEISGFSSSSTFTSLKVITRTFLTKRAGRYISHTQASCISTSK
jgi:hypothetical protein